MHNLFARRDDVIEDYHGTKVADPYRWLENPASADTLAWVEAQNAITSQYISAIPARTKIQARLTAFGTTPNLRCRSKGEIVTSFTKIPVCKINLFSPRSTTCRVQQWLGVIPTPSS